MRCAVYVKFCAGGRLRRQRGAGQHTPQVRLDFDLAAQLVLNTGLLQLRLEEHLQCHDVLGSLLPRQVDVAELAPPERLADIEVTELPFLLAAGCLPANEAAGEGQRQRGAGTLEARRWKGASSSNRSRAAAGSGRCGRAPEGLAALGRRRHLGDRARFGGT